MTLALPSTPTAPGRRSPPHLATLVALSALAIMSTNLFLPSLPGMATDFGVPYGTVAISIAGYLAVTAVLQLILGPLADIWGRRPVILGCLALFTAASVGCWLAQDVWTFLAFRMMQGAVIAGSALSRAIVRDLVAGPRAASVLGTMGMAMAVAPMLAPILGGALDQVFGWRASFAFFALAGAALLAVSWADLGETHRGGGGFGAQFRAWPALLGARLFWANALCLAFGIGSFYTFVAGAPLVAAILFQMSPTALGVWLGAITMGFAVGNFVTSRVADRFSLGQMMVAGRAVALLAPCLSLALLGVIEPNPWSLFGPIVFAGFGNGLSALSANVGVLSVRPDLAGSASGLSGALTVGTGAVLTTLVAWVLTPDDAAWALMALLAGVMLISLAAAIAVLRAEG